MLLLLAAENTTILKNNSRIIKMRQVVCSKNIDFGSNYDNERNNYSIVFWNLAIRCKIN